MNRCLLSGFAVIAVLAAGSFAILSEARAQGSRSVEAVEQENAELRQRIRQLEAEEENARLRPRVRQLELKKGDTATIRAAEPVTALAFAKSTHERTVAVSNIVKAPPPLEPVPIWTGAYIGGTLGFGQDSLNVIGESCNGGKFGHFSNVES